MLKLHRNSSFTPPECQNCHVGDAMTLNCKCMWFTISRSDRDRLQTAVHVLHFDPHIMHMHGTTLHALWSCMAHQLVNPTDRGDNSLPQSVVDSSIRGQLRRTAEGQQLFTQKRLHSVIACKDRIKHKTPVFTDWFWLELILYTTYRRFTISTFVSIPVSFQQSVQLLRYVTYDFHFMALRVQLMLICPTFSFFALYPSKKSCYEHVSGLARWLYDEIQKTLMAPSVTNEQ